MPVEKETFLIVQGPTTSFARAFIFQGSYDEVYKLPHEHWDLHVYLLTPEPGQENTPHGAQLVEVCHLIANARALSYVRLAALDLRHMPLEQRLRELHEIQQLLRTESKPLVEREYPSTPQGDLQRLTDLGITPLTEEEMERMRR